MAKKQTKKALVKKKAPAPVKHSKQKSGASWKKKAGVKEKAPRSAASSRAKGVTKQQVAESIRTISKIPKPAKKARKAKAAAPAVAPGPKRKAAKARSWNQEPTDTLTLLREIKVEIAGIKLQILDLKRELLTPEVLLGELHSTITVDERDALTAEDFERTEDAEHQLADDLSVSLEDDASDYAEPVINDHEADASHV